MRPEAEKPMVSFLLNGFSPALLNVTSNVTGFVMPTRVRSPRIVPLFSPVTLTLVLLNVISGYSLTLKKSAEWRCSLNFSPSPSMFSDLSVRFTELFSGFS